MSSFISGITANRHLDLMLIDLSEVVVNHKVETQDHLNCRYASEERRNLVDDLREEYSGLSTGKPEFAFCGLPREILALLCLPLEMIPLFINHYNPTVKKVVSWRLKISR